MKINKNAPYNEVREITDLKDMLESSCRLYGDRVAFLRKEKSGETYKEITYNQLKSDVDAFGTALIDMGLKDENIVIIGENRYEWAVAYLAVINGVGTVVPLDKELPEAEIENLIVRAKVSAVIYSNRKKEQINNICSRVESIKTCIGMDNDQEISMQGLIEKGKKLIKKDKRFIEAKIDAYKPSIILFTSGTTSQSKGVLLSHHNIAYDMMCGCRSILVEPEDRFFSVLPLHHTYECTAGFLIPLYRGASIAYCEGLRYIAKNMQEARPTMMLAVPAIFENIYGKIWESIKKQGKEKTVKKMESFSWWLFSKLGIDIRAKVFKQIHANFGGKLRIGIVGAAAMNPEVIEGYRKLGIHMIQGYGLTEAAPLAALNRDAYYNDKSAGREVPGIALRIDSPNDEGIGEICIKGDNVMLGYYENEEATNEAIIDGWLHTGDLGYIDNEGFLFITGRIKSVLITKNGKNVYPEEVEAIINKSPIIKESMIYQKENKDGDDTFIAAIIVPDYEYIKENFDANISEDELKDKLWEEVKKANSELVNYKHVKEIKIRKEEFEKTTTLKIKRYLVEK